MRAIWTRFSQLAFQPCRGSPSAQTMCVSLFTQCDVTKPSANAHALSPVNSKMTTQTQSRLLSARSSAGDQRKGAEDGQGMTPAREYFWVWVSKTSTVSP